MEGDEEEASHVNKPPLSQLQEGTAAMPESDLEPSATRFQCDSESNNESAQQKMDEEEVKSDMVEMQEGEGEKALAFEVKVEEESTVVVEVAPVVDDIGVAEEVKIECAGEKEKEKEPEVAEEKGKEDEMEVVKKDALGDLVEESGMENDAVKIEVEEHEGVGDIEEETNLAAQVEEKETVKVADVEDGTVKQEEVEVEEEEEIEGEEEREEIEGGGGGGEEDEKEDIEAGGDEAEKEKEEIIAEGEEDEEEEIDAEKEEDEKEEIGAEEDEEEAIDAEKEEDEKEEIDAEEEEDEKEEIDAEEEEDEKEGIDAEEEEGEKEKIDAEEEEDEKEDIEEAGEEDEKEDIEAEGEEDEKDVDTEGEDEGVAMETEVAEEADVADAMEETTEAEGTENVDEATAMEVVVEEVGRGSSNGKRKRGKNNKAPAKVNSRKKLEEDVCFICFDGGELVLCDRRGCPKAYHPSCVNRDEAFFRTKGRWNCGWHLCSICEKNAHFWCYTCTFSLCKGCIKSNTILCLRENKGLCEPCMKTVMLIEKNEGKKNADNIDFDDRSSWEYLFKDYWIDLKEKLSLTLEELAEAKNPFIGSDSHKQESADEPYNANDDVGSDSDGSSDKVEPSNTKKRKTKKRVKSRTKDKDSRKATRATASGGQSAGDNNAWASKELLEFVMHMRNGDISPLSQFDVQALLLEYIKRNKLRDPRRKSQIICDSRLQNLFGKPRVGHFEMLKLLESHFLAKEDSHTDDLQGSVVDTEASQLEADGNDDGVGKSGKDKKRKSRRKGDGKGPQSNLDDYAAIDNHNINLIYLRRNLVEDLIDDTANFHDKVVGAFARIRISGTGQKQDLYRLVQVTGTTKAAEPYKVGKKTTDTVLEILNLNKTEVVSIDIISNQEFTEDECKRLRQSIKCGLINRLTVGDVQEKAMTLQSVRVKDWLESEIVRLSHLRDRASEKGRQCVEKLQLLKTPEERQRRLEDIPEIHADPNMDPNFESEEEEDAENKRKENFMRSRGSGFSRRGRDPISPRKGGSSSGDTWSGGRSYFSSNQEPSRNRSSRGFSGKAEDTTVVGEIVNDTWNQGREREAPNSWEKKRMSTSEMGSRNSHAAESTAVPDNLASSLPTGVTESPPKINESEKNWYYKDPSGKVQGPFSIAQLRKWSGTGYFPVDLRIWKASDKEDDSMLLTDVLTGKFQKEKVQVLHNLPPSPTPPGKPQVASMQRATEIQVGGESWRSQNEISPLSAGKVVPTPVDVSKYSSDTWGSTNLPSPTPTQTPLGGAKPQTYENKWSGNTVLSNNSMVGMNQFPGSAGGTREGAMRVAENDSSSFSAMTSKSEKNMTTNDLPIHHFPTISAPTLNHASLNTNADIQNVVSNLQSLVQSVANQMSPVPKPEMLASGPITGAESQPWRGTPSQKLEPNNPGIMHAQPSAHALWSDASAIHNPASFNAGNAVGNFPTSGFTAAVPQSDSWRPNIQPQPQAPPNMPYSMGVVDNQTGAPRVPQDNQNQGWAPPVAGNPNMGWSGQVPGNANPNWGVPPSQVLPPGNTNPGWHNQVRPQVSGWVPSGQGPATPITANTNQGWVGHGQVQGQGNTNPGWGGVPGGNSSNWGSERNHNTDRFANQRDMGSQGVDSGYGGGKPWNRQSSFGGGSGGGGGGSTSRTPFKGQRVCKFHESGHCKKGASCDYLHN
ncbi:hypothetical protein G4B88_021424 [Cannabis sativa]|uniref:Zinc finger CCCH domain-containing protein 19 n=1 Tax=Cannabis sativa TaxID=3483 RepID=A0A7J6FIA8_CANSA|nr:hypothetical protein G4B88_021424 [Cannabis sativa]